MAQTDEDLPDLFAMDDVENPKTELTQFTYNFFDYFGAKVKEAGRKGKKYLSVSLSKDMSAYFGKDKLSLVFTTEDSGKERELVATGSRVFDQMLEHLNGCSALTVQQLPSLHGGGEELMQAIRPINASIAGLKMAEQSHHLFIFNWRITYRADDKRESLYTVVLDENGQRLPLKSETPENDRAVDIHQLLEDAEAIPVEHNEDGQPLPTKLPPMTRLTELAENARKFAIYHADLHSVALETEIQPRLFKALSRLHGYYSQQIEEVYESHDLSGEKRKLLEADLQRKLAEEVENHRLRVQVDLFSYAMIQMPVAVADLTLSDGLQQVQIGIRRNRYTGTLQRPTCHSCNTQVTDVAIDKRGHVTCNDCLNQCAACLTVHCNSCGVKDCPVCETSNCDECSQFCWACGEHACQAHASQCPVCFDTVCHVCQIECAHCQTRQCLSHLRADCVATVDGAVVDGILNSAGPPAGGSGINALICGDCAVRCAGCQQYSAHFDVCESSGQRFCLNCLGKCVDCGRTTGPDFHHVNPGDNQIYCLDCLSVCPTCQSPTAEVEECAYCEKPCCAGCHQTCMECQQQFCEEHAHALKACGHIFCETHAEKCGVGHEAVCSVCSEACSICSRFYCEEHEAMCELCRLTYCRECVRQGLQLCDTCATIREHGSSVFMADEPIAVHRDVAPLVHRYRWQRAGHERYTIYLGQGPFNSGVLVLTENGTDGEELLVVRKLSALDRYWRNY